MSYLFLHCDISYYICNLVVESDSSYAISWMNSSEGHGNFNFLSNGIKFLPSWVQVNFLRVSRLAIGMEDASARKGWKGM